MRLSDCIVKTVVTSKVTYDEDNKVGFELAFLPKAELQKITANNTRLKPNPKTHQMEEVMDSEAVKKEICDKAVKGWYGMTYKWISRYIPIDFTVVKEDEEMAFSQENLTDLMENMYGLDGWIFESVKNAANFKDSIAKAEVKN